MRDSCPGSREIRTPYPEEILCPYCGRKNEIWSDEPDMKCCNCNRTITRAMLPSCVEWCLSARDCVGTVKYNRIMLNSRKKS
ncbi:MAG TPA: hypothetical protein VK445_03010 [Dissulfurispiraceae bacterium]|nr:hypothetical protein [Dissulfurispiraceae bacterium]